MKREELNTLIDRVTSGKGILRTSAYWVRKVLHAIIGYVDEADSKKGVERKIVSGNTVAMSPNIFYIFKGNSLSVTLSPVTDDGLVKEYLIKIICIGTPSITLPESIIWANDAPPEFTEGKTYQISIIDNLAVVAIFLND